MRIRSVVPLVAMLAVVTFTVPALTKPVSKNINISQPATLGGSQLSAGEYHLLIDGTKVTVEKAGKIVAEVTGRWEERDTKSRYNSVLLGPGGQVQEIRFAGDRRVLVLSAQ